MALNAAPSDPSWVVHLRKARSSKRIGRKILFLPTLDSTNRQARDEACRGAPEGLVVIADGQSAGKGRRGRLWESPGGANLYASVVLRPSLPIEKVPQITLISGIAVARALDQVSGLPALIKWPNDIWIRGRKIAGILAEAELRGERVQFVILGIGINVNWKREDLPDALAETATSLRAEAGREFSRGEVAETVMDRLEEAYEIYRVDGFCERLRDEWNRLSGINGRRVRAEITGRGIEGRFLRLDTDGALLLLDDTGQTHRLIGGEISLRL
jgi:BirA family biotin operon repressor/biotin-[acetyl-CoA-carboxylase] ligase